MNIKKKALLDSIISKVPCNDSLMRLASRIQYRNKLIILNYHLIVEENPYLPDWCCLPVFRFAEQMSYLAHHFEVLPLAQGVESLYRQERRERPIAVITFDDGFYNNYSQAFPILQALQLPATIFLTTGLVNGDDTLWFCKLNKALSKTMRNSFVWCDNLYETSSIEAKTQTFRRLQKELKKLPHQILENEVAHILLELSSDWDGVAVNSTIYRMLDSNAIEDMLASGLIDFGAHTRDHVILSRVTPKEQQKQIYGSIDDVKALTGRSQIPFAYPNGSATDYSDFTIREIKRAGANYGVTMVPGLSTRKTNPHELKRVGVGGDWEMGVFRFAVCTGFTAGL